MDPTQISIGWDDVIKLAFGTGFVVALFNQVFGWFRDWRREKAATTREGGYLASRLAATLERFSIECAELISSNKLHDDTGGENGKQCSSLPELGAFPDDADWRSLDVNLSARALTMQNELTLSRTTVDFWLDMDPYDELIPAFNDQAGKCGYIAWQVATDLRRRYGLPKYDPSSTNWDLVGKLKKHHDKALEKVNWLENAKPKPKRPLRRLGARV